MPIVHLPVVHPLCRTHLFWTSKPESTFLLIDITTNFFLTQVERFKELFMAVEQEGRNTQLPPFRVLGRKTWLSFLGSSVEFSPTILERIRFCRDLAEGLL